LLTGLLGLVYFGGVALLQTLLSAAGGQPSLPRRAARLTWNSLRVT